MLRTFHFLPSNPVIPFLHAPKSTLSSLPTRPPNLSAHSHRPATGAWLAQIPEEPDATPSPPDEGPIEIPSSVPAIFADSDDPTPIQTATGLLLTGAVAVFLFRSVRRRAKRAKELQFRSSGAKKSLKEEALESLRVMAPTPVDPKSPPSPVQAFLGALSAGVIALILYKFTITVEDGLNHQPLSDNFSVRQITITIRTFINGICYLATCVFGFNSLGLFLYSGQLALKSFAGDSTRSASNDESKSQLSSSNAVSQISVDGSEKNTVDGDQSSDSAE